MPDIFANEEGYVGVEPSAQPSENAQTSFANDDISGEGVADGGRGGAFDHEVNDADPQKINVLHDPENPRIGKDALFPDIIYFWIAIRHYVVKEGFEFTKVQPHKTRFIAMCAAKGCPCRIHASRIYDEKTIQV